MIPFSFSPFAEEGGCAAGTKTNKGDNRTPLGKERWGERDSTWCGNSQLMERGLSVSFCFPDRFFAVSHTPSALCCVHNGNFVFVHRHNGGTATYHITNSH